METLNTTQVYDYDEREEKQSTNYLEKSKKEKTEKSVTVIQHYVPREFSSFMMVCAQNVSCAIKWKI